MMKLDYNTLAEYSNNAEYNSQGEYNGPDPYNGVDPYSSNQSEWDSLPYEVESIDDCTPSVVDSLAFVSQMKSLFQVIFGDVQGARCTQINFSKTNPAAGLIRSGIEAASGDGVSAVRTLEKLGDNTYTMVKGIPVVGHGIVVGHYIAGDTKTGDDIMKGATRSIPVIVGGTFGGPAGAIAAGAAYDGTVTGIESAVHGEYRPYGLVSSATNIVNGKVKAGEAYDTSFGLFMDGVSGYIAKSKANVNKNVQAGPDVTKYGSSSNGANFEFPERVFSDTDSMASVKSQSSANLSPTLSRRSSLGSLTADVGDLRISPVEGPKTISARSSWEMARVNTNVDPSLKSLPVTQYNCAFCTVAALKRTTLNKLLDNLNQMDVDGPNMAVSGQQIGQIFKDSGFVNVAAQEFAPVLNAPQPMVPLQSSPVANYLNTALAPGSKEVYGLAYNHAGGGGHVVVMKAWKTPQGVIGSRIIDFQQPVGSSLRFINGQVPSGPTHLIQLNGLPVGTGGVSSGLPSGSGFGSLAPAVAGGKVSVGGGMAVGTSSRIAAATFPGTVQGMGNIRTGSNKAPIDSGKSKTTSTPPPLLKAFPSTTASRLATVAKPTFTVGTFPGPTTRPYGNAKLDHPFTGVNSRFPG